MTTDKEKADQALRDEIDKTEEKLLYLKAGQKPPKD